MTGTEDVSYETSQILRLGSLENGGTIKLSTAEGETPTMGISPDKLKLIAAILTGQPGVEPGPARTVPCNCEQIGHETGENGMHAYLGVPAGLRRAHYVGLVCDVCAETCMAGMLVGR